MIGSMIAQGAGQALNAMFGWIGQRREHKRNIADWERQNAYNHPSAQMERLKEAGLNPALIYGNNANTGMAGTINESGRAEPTKFDLNPMQTMMMHQNIKQSKANTDNLRLQGGVLQKEAMLKDAMIGETRARTDNYRQDLSVKSLGMLNTQLQMDNTRLQMARTADERRRIQMDIRKTETEIRNIKQQMRFASGLFPHQVDAQAEQVRKLEQETIGLQIENRWKDPLMSARVKDLYARIALAKSQMTGQDLINALRELEREAKAVGINEGDPWYFRIGLRGLQRGARALGEDMQGPKKSGEY